MLKVVFVADEPSRLNVDKSIPFVGAKSFDRFINWIKQLGPDYYVVLNSNTKSDLRRVKKLYNEGFKVVAVGRKASDRLYKYDIQHGHLPHPSGLNRQLNDDRMEWSSIAACQEYLYEYEDL